MADSWYYIRDKRKVGPVALGELGKLSSSGQLHGTDMVLQQGSVKWVPASTVSGLKFAADIIPSAATPAPGINSTPEGMSRLQPFLWKWNRWIIGSVSGLVALLVVSLLIAGRPERDPVGKIPIAMQETPKSEVSAQLPSVSPPVAQKAPAADEPPPQGKGSAKKQDSAANKDKSVVVAEGVGTTGDAALKDAFRKAVRQVVGAVVDAETLVKDDQIISDKVLTYSDGFVKTYEEISDSQDMGIFRTKINATVERRSLIAKLKVANVAVKDVDGKGIFAEVVTDLEAAKNAKELMEKALEGFPGKLFQAEVIGKPELIHKTASSVELKIRVRFEVNVKEYDAFAAKLRTTLTGITRARGEFAMSGQKADGIGSPRNALAVRDFRRSLAGRTSQVVDPIPRPKPPANDDPFIKAKKGLVVLALCNRTSAGGKQTHWQYFAVDDSVKSVLVACCTRTLALKLSLLSQDGGVVVTKGGTKGWRGAVPTDLVGRDRDQFSDSYFLTPICPGNGRFIDFHPVQRLIESNLNKESIFLIAPLFIITPHPSDHSVYYSPVIEMPVVLNLSLEKVKSVSSIKCDLTN